MNERVVVAQVSQKAKLALCQRRDGEIGTPEDYDKDRFSHNTWLATSNFWKD